MGLRKFLTSLGLSVVSSDPAGGQNGELYYNDTSHTIRAFINGSWVSLGLSGASLPTGGTTGQILAKIDATNYNTQWIDNYTSQVKHEVKLAESVTVGQAVYVSSANGTNMLVSKASNASEATSSKTMGLVASSGVTNDIVFVVTEGLISGIDTSSAGAEGDPVWLGTNGNLIYGLTNKPSAPAHLVFIGVVTRKQQINGEIFVKVQNGFELQEIHNVLIGTGYSSTPSNNDLLAYETATSLWKNKSFSSLGLLTSATAASTYQPLDADLTSIAALTGSSGFLKTNGSGTWSVDTTTYAPINNPTFTGTVNASSTLTIGSQLTFSNPGVGNATQFIFTKSSDSAWLKVTERASDQTQYEFGMADNPDSGDYYQWRFNDWQNAATGWMPLQIGGMTTRFVALNNNMWGNLSIPTNTPFYTANQTASGGTDYDINVFAPTTSTSFNLNKDAGTGTGTLNVDVTGYTNTINRAIYVIVDSGATTFTWGYGGYSFPANNQATGVAITGGWQTLAEGIQIKLSLSGHVASDRWSFRAYPRPRLGIGGSPLTTSMATIYPTSSISGLVIRQASGQSAVPFDIQNNSATSIFSVSASGGISLSSMTMDSVAFTDTNVQAVTSTSATTVFTLSTTYSAAEFLVQATQGAKKTLSKLLMVNDGTDISLTEYAITELGATKVPLTMSAILSGGNLLLQATVSDANINSATIRVVTTAVVA